MFLCTVTCSLFSGILFNDLQSSTNSPISHLKLFQKFAIQSQDIFPYHLTFCHRVNKAPYKDTTYLWNNIIQSSILDNADNAILDDSTDFKITDLDNSIGMIICYIFYN